MLTNMISPVTLEILLPTFGTPRRAENYMPLYGGECDIVYSKDRIFGKKGKAVLPGEPYIDG